MARWVVLRDADEVRAFTHRARRDDVTILASTPGAVLACENRNVPFIDVMGLQRPDEDAAQCTGAAHALSTTWWQNDVIRSICPQLTSYHGIRLAELMELHLYHVFAEAQLSLLLAERLIAQEKPTDLGVFHRDEPAGSYWSGFDVNLTASALELLAQERGMPVRILSGRVLRPPTAAPLTLRGAAGWTWKTARGLLGWIGKLASRRGANVGKALPGAAPILLWAEADYACPMLPLLKAIVSDRQLWLVAAVQDMSHRAVRTLRGIAAALVFPPGWLDPALARQVREDVREVRAAWPAIDGYFSKFGLRHEGSVSLWPLVRYQFRWFFQHGFADVLPRVRQAQRASDTLRPTVYLTPLDGSARALAWILGCQSRKVKCVELLHGVVYDRPRPHGWGLPHVDRVLVTGPLAQEWFTQATHRPLEDFPCVGSPTFDDAQKAYAAVDPAKIYRRLRFSSSKPTVLFLSSMTGGALRSHYAPPLGIYRSVLREVAQINGVQIMVRTHPAADKQLAKAAARQCAVRCIVDPPFELNELLRIVDVVISQPTSALVQAAVLGKPILFYTAGMARDLAWWAERTHLRRVSHESELAEAVRKLLADADERDRLVRAQVEFVAQVTGPQDGQSAQRAHEFLRSMALGSRHPQGAVVS